MTDNEINSLKTDVALIKRDIGQIEKVFSKVDEAVNEMAEIHMQAAVQEKILENTERRIETLEDAFIKHSDEEKAYRRELSTTLSDMRSEAQEQRERRHKEVLESIQKMNDAVALKLEAQGRRIQALENWKWWVLGASAALVFLLDRYQAILSIFS